MQKRKKTSNTKYIIVLTLLALAAISAFFFLNTGKISEKTTAISPEQEREKLQEKVNVLEKNMPREKIQEPADQPAGLSGQADSDAAANKQSSLESAGMDPCQERANRIDAFFAQLDSKDYIIDSHLDGGSKVYLAAVVNKILENKPKITREKDDLLSILQNAAHFFRILGKNDLIILKKIMTHEKEFYEPVMADFFNLFVYRENCLHINYPIQLPLEDMYSYAVYFLDTLGGQAYLFRREPVLRTLMKYYSVLVLDQANMKNANPLGIDIRYHLNSLIDELNAISDLQDKGKYLDNLLKLREKYEKLYGK